MDNLIIGYIRVSTSFTMSRVFKQIALSQCQLLIRLKHGVNYSIMLYHVYSTNNIMIDLFGC